MELYFNAYTCMNLDDATYMYYHDQTSINEEKKITYFSTVLDTSSEEFFQTRVRSLSFKLAFMAEV